MKKKRFQSLTDTHRCFTDEQCCVGVVVCALGFSVWSCGEVYGPVPLIHVTYTHQSVTQSDAQRLSISLFSVHTVDDK